MGKTSLTNLSLFLDSLFEYIEGHPKGLFINHRTILVLHKLHQDEQHHLRGKENSNLTRTENRSKKEIARTVLLVDLYARLVD